MFRVEMTVLDDGERMPLLYRSEPYVPVLPVLLYIAIRRRYQKSRTLLRDVRALQALYHWCESIRHGPFDLDTRLQRGDMLSASDIEAFARWMRVRRPPRLVSEASETVVPFPLILKPVSLHNSLGAVRLYLRWAAQRYRPERGRHAKAEALRSQTLLIDETFNAVRIRGRTPDLEKGLEPEDMRRLLEFSNPRHSQNPFRTRLRRRNALILALLYETGIRRGELLKLKVDDLLKDGDGNCFISVCRRPDDLTDTRSCSCPSAAYRSRSPKSIICSFGSLCAVSVVASRCIRTYCETRSVMNSSTTAQRGRNLTRKQPRIAFAYYAAGVLPPGCPNVIRGSAFNVKQTPSTYGDRHKHAPAVTRPRWAR